MATLSDNALSPRGLARLNAADDDALRAELTACCAATAWIDAVLARRPFASDRDLIAVSDEATAALDDAGLAEALAAHPRIGERPAEPGQAAAWSRREQSGMALVDQDIRAQLVAGNTRYERRFGHVYLVCASGKSASELLAICRSRLRNDAATERVVVLAELAKINRIRLGRLLHSGDPR